MTDRITKFIYGEVRFCADFQNSLLFLDVIRDRAEAFDVELIPPHRILFSVTRKNASEVFSLAAKYSVNVSVCKEKGILFYFQNILKRKGVIAGAAAAFAIILFCSLKIADIRIVGNMNTETEIIEKNLELSGLKRGSLIFADAEKIKNLFLIAMPEISWISVNIKGNIAYVEVKERDIKPDEREDDTFYNIVASTDGIIKRIDVLDGGKEAENGESVVKGQLLISSFYKSKNNNIFLRSAIGNVYAYTDRIFEVKIPKICFEKKYTGKTKTSNQSNLFGFVISDLTKPGFLYCDYLSEIYKNKIFGMYLPFETRRISYLEYDCVRKARTQEEAAVAAENILENKIAIFKKGAEVISSEFITEDDDDCYIFRLEAKCVENIGKKVRISPENLQINEEIS